MVVTAKVQQENLSGHERRGVNERERVDLRRVYINIPDKLQNVRIIVCVCVCVYVLSILSWNTWMEYNVKAIALGDV